MKVKACRRYLNNKKLGKLTYFIKTALPCVPFSTSDKSDVNLLLLYRTLQTAFLPK